MTKDEFVRLVERLVREGRMTGPIVCRARRGRIPDRSVDNRTREAFIAHLEAQNPDMNPPDVRPLSNGMWVAVARSDNRQRLRRTSQLLDALGLAPDEYLAAASLRP